MALPRRTGRSRITLALLVLTSIAVLTLDYRDAGVVEGARDVAATVLSPFRSAAATLTAPVRNGWNGIIGFGDLEKENERLRALVEDLEGREVRGEVAAAELEALLAEVGITWMGDTPTTTARVIAGPVSNFSHTIELDKGSDDGIALGMPVVSGAGLVGRVQQVTGSRTTVVLLTDPDFRVGVRTTDGVLGTARGSGRGRPLLVDTGLDADEPVEPEGTLTTSGADRSAFPSSIPVGTVRGAEPSAGGLTLNLVVEPLVDTERLTFVTVLLWEGEG